MSTENNNSKAKQELYENIVSNCENLHIAKYLKDEVRDILKLFHFHKLSNIKKNESDFFDYLKIINNENCNRIQRLKTNNKKRNMNNTISYYYDSDDFDNNEEISIKDKIESNDYEIFSVMQSIKGYLILTIDEFCNASETRINIIHYQKNKAKVLNA